MAIQGPENWLTQHELELLELLARLLVYPRTALANFPPGDVPLSDKEGRRLVALLEDLVASKKFQDSVYFVEGMTQDHPENRLDLREIYLKYRSRSGRTRALSSSHWRSFLFRFGVIKFDWSSASRLDSPTREMSYEYFVRMEDLLLRKQNLSPRIRSIILEVVNKYKSDTELSRRGRFKINHGIIADSINSLIDGMKGDSNNLVEPLKSHQIAGLATVVADFSVLFTTRDWSVAGSLSTIAGAMAVIPVR